MLQRFADEIRQALASKTGLAEHEIRLELPRDEKLGDLAFPCFQSAKAQKRAPPAVASELAAALALPGISVSATGPYLNFRVDRTRLARETCAEVERQGGRYGGSDDGRGQTIVIDFSSPNIAKPMHIGHIRSTILGAALKRIVEALGYRAVGINHIGDWGAQFGGLVVAIRRWKGEVDLERDSVRGLLELYQRSKQAVDSDPQFREEARAAYRELESGRDGEVREIWRWVTAASLAGFERTYARLGIVHEFVRGESFYEPFLTETVERVSAAGVTEVSQGALIVALGGIDKGLKDTPCLLRQTDGTTLYATRDLAALFHRWNEFAFERCLYVVGGEQKLHFRQLKAVLVRMGIPWEPHVEHVDFGLLLGPDGKKFKSREGDVIILDEIIDEVVAEAAAVIREKNPDLAQAERVAEEVAIGAIVFNDLKRERIRDVVFDKRAIVSFEGDTGPYVQYTHARLGSILAKAGERGEGSAAPDWGALENAGPILLRVARLPDVVKSAAKGAEPSLIASWLVEVSREISSWLAENRVLGSDPPIGAARVALVRCAKTALVNGMAMLGLARPEEM